MCLSKPAHVKSAGGIQGISRTLVHSMYSVKTKSGSSITFVSLDITL